MLKPACSLLVLIVGLSIPAFGQPPVEAPELLPAAEIPPPIAVPADTKPVRMPREHHCWCHLKPGAWRTLRITTETFDVSGKSLGLSITTETETLGEVNDAHYALESQSEVEVGGSKLRGPTRQHILQMITDSADERSEAFEQPAEQINLDGHPIPCSVWHVKVMRSDRQLVYDIYYNDSVWPFVLRRDVVETSADGADPLSTTRVTVVRSQVPIVLNERIVTGAHFLSTTETPAGRTERFEVHSHDVPGGLVSKATTEWDAEGHRIRWSTTELVDYGTENRERRPLRRLLRRGRDG